VRLNLFVGLNERFSQIQQEWKFVLVTKLKQQYQEKNQLALGYEMQKQKLRWIEVE
jgi:hypothetical protein